MSKKLAEGWCEGQIRARRRDGERDVLLPVVFQDIAEVYESKPRKKAEWFPAHAAPDRAFESAEPDALKKGERVYVDCPRDPELAGSANRFRGRGTIRGVYGGEGLTLTVHMEGGVHRNIAIPRAACHREGPQSEPLDEGAVFLGRFTFPHREGPDRTTDLWWADGGVSYQMREPVARFVIRSPADIETMTHGEARAAVWEPALAVARALGLVDEPAAEAEPSRDIPDGLFIGHFETPDGRHAAWWLSQDRAIQIHACSWPVATIDAGKVIHRDWLPAYRTALAVARRRGWVEAEPERAEEGSQADMMDLAEPKFQVGQWGKCPTGMMFTRFCIDRRTWDDEEHEWFYGGFTAGGSYTEAGEEYLEPCAPVLTAEQEALRPKDSVQSIPVPVGPDGAPIVKWNGCDTISSTTRLVDRPDKAVLSSGRVILVHNLRLVRKAEPD